MSGGLSLFSKRQSVVPAPGRERIPVGAAPTGLDCGGCGTNRNAGAAVLVPV